MKYHEMLFLGLWMVGSPCHMSNLRKPHVTMLILRKCHVPCHYLFIFSGNKEMSPNETSGLVNSRYLYQMQFSLLLNQETIMDNNEIFF